MQSNKSESVSLRLMQRLPADSYKKTLMLFSGLILVCLTLFLAGCASSSPQPTKTVSMYVGPQPQDVKLIPPPVWRGSRNEDILELLEELTEIIQVHNVEQESLRQRIREAQAISE